MTATPDRLEEAQGLLRQDDPQAAEAIAAEVLSAEPGNIEAMYTLAVTQRFQHHWTDALDTIDRILAVKPGFGRAHQEAGYNRIALKEFHKAGIAFEAAVNSDPSLINSWKCLAKLFSVNPAGGPG